MMRWLLTIALVLSLAWGGIEPAIADAPTLPSEEQLQAGEALAQKAIAATEKGDFAQAETYWSQLIADFPTNPAVWSNRGNARVSQMKLDDAIADFNKAIELAPDATDPYLNRGAALEGKGQYQLAIADYNRVLEIDPKDAMAYNNRGNAEAGLGDWDTALADYRKASEIAPNFAFARANQALVLYQTGKPQESLTLMRNLARKYPMFPDVRAALTAVLWNQGKQGEAESNWVAAVGMDHRYQDLDWVKSVRRWPPAMVAALDRFLHLQ
jgi:tetratricopeptide (TPR) repeat protein